MGPRSISFACILLLGPLGLSGCLGGDDDAARPGPDGTPPGPLPALAFDAPLVIDGLRAGGEPVIGIGPTGTIVVSSHPGWTHKSTVPGPELLVPASGESYMWRSTDDGASWTYVGVPMADAGKRGPTSGVSDPDIAVGPDGSFWYTDLWLGSAGVAVSRDDGVTWVTGNPAVTLPAHPGVDRQWLAVDDEGTAFFVVNELRAGWLLLRSADGVVWEDLGYVGGSGPPGDIAADPRDGTLYIYKSGSLWVSTDRGVAWEERPTPGGGGGLDLSEPAIDAAGNVYVAWTEGGRVQVSGSPDQGRTWGAPINVSDHGSATWAWIVAGDAGRVAVAWLQNDEGEAPDEATGDWFVDAGFVLDAMGRTPQVLNARLTPEAVHTGEICVGTVCQATMGDRRLGDFFEAAVSPTTGLLHVVYPTTASGDSVSHAAHVRQSGGPLLLTPP